MRHKPNQVGSQGRRTVTNFGLHKRHTSSMRKAANVVSQSGEFTLQPIDVAEVYLVFIDNTLGHFNYVVLVGAEAEVH